DGRRWHTRDRLTRTGKAVRWDGLILERVVDRLAELGGFAAPDWSQRSVVRIAHPAGGPAVFEAITGHEWIIPLRSRLPRNTFKPADLAAELGLTPFHDGPTPVLSDAERLTVANSRGLGQEVVITCHAAADLATEAFDAFLRRAVVAAL